MTSKETYNEFKCRCIEHGCRCTPQRLAVYDYVKDNLAHPSVNQVWEHVQKEIPSITRESVFRILTEFADFGIVNRMDKIIDARFDGYVKNHGHLICERCGCIVDFELPEGCQVPSDFSDFVARHIELRISGLCANCAEAKSKEHQVTGDDNGTERK